MQCLQIRGAATTGTAPLASAVRLPKSPVRLAQLPKQPIQIAKLAGGGGAPVILRPPLPGGGMSLIDINSKLPKQPVPRAQIGNASPSSKPGAKSPIKVVAIAGPGNKKATPVTLQAAGVLLSKDCHRKLSPYMYSDTDSFSSIFRRYRNYDRIAHAAVTADHVGRSRQERAGRCYGQDFDKDRAACGCPLLRRRTSAGKTTTF